MKQRIQILPLAIIAFFASLLIGRLIGWFEHQWPSAEKFNFVLEAGTIILLGAIFGRAVLGVPVGLTFGYVAAYGPGTKTGVAGGSLAIGFSPIFFLICLFLALMGAFLRKIVSDHLIKKGYLTGPTVTESANFLVWIIVAVSLLLVVPIWILILVW